MNHLAGGRGMVRSPETIRPGLPPQFSSDRSFHRTISVVTARVRVRTARGPEKTRGVSAGIVKGKPSCSLDASRTIRGPKNSPNAVTNAVAAFTLEVVERFGGRAELVDHLVL